MVVLEELKEYLRPLSPDELFLLEESCVEDGVLHPMIAWRRGEELILIDGHHRYQIAQKHDLSFDVLEKDFEDIQAVKDWMSSTQRGRRNISDYRKIELELGCSVSERNTTKDLAAKTGFSTGKISSANYVMKNAPEELKELARRGDVSVDQAYQRTRKLETPQDYNDKEKVINQIPPAFKADIRMCSILVYFELNKNREASHIALAKEWRDKYGLNEDNLPVDTIVKNYIRIRDSIRKDKSKILQYIN